MESPASVEEAGSALLQPYATLDELVNRISSLDRLLRRVEQQPSTAMQRALKIPIEALTTDELLKSVDLNVKILVGCCICEISRITAPEPPYEENKTRDVSDLLLTIIKSLSLVTGNAYRKASSVLAIVSRFKLFNTMWDCDEAFIIEMFREFLHLQTNHADDVISEMEEIMTLLLDEEGVPGEIFIILLKSLKKDNENLYPVSYNLAERVFHNCADVIKQRLPIEVRLSEIVPYDYSQVVARVLNVRENGNIMVSTSRKRCWKPNFLHKLEEGYDGLWVDNVKRSSDALPRRRNNMKDLKCLFPSSSKDSFPSRKRSRKGKPRSAYHTLMEDENLELSSSRMGSKKRKHGVVKHSRETKVQLSDDDDTLTLSDLLKKTRRDRTKLDVPTPSFSSSILIRDAILRRYGDITANCLYKSKSMRESLMEVVCNVVWRLNNSVVTTSDIKAMTLEISDAAEAKLDVSWLQKFLVDIGREEEAAKTADNTRTTTIFTIGTAQKEVEHRQVEMALAKIKMRDAKRRVEALKCVLTKIDINLMVSVAREKSWKKRLDELLTPR